MKPTILTAFFAAAALSAGAATVDFDKHFNDSTLRLDYIFGADSLRTHILLTKQVLTPGWAGRRHNLDKLPLSGNSQITVTDYATGDTIYRHSFSSLFQEWLSTPEAATDARSFESTYLIPQPQRKARIDLDLYNNHFERVGHVTNVYSPDDILVRRPKVRPIEHRYLHKAADPENAIDVAILAEGYTIAEMDSFYHHAQVAADEILSYEPFAAYADKINFVAVASPSVDSGVSVPRFNDWKDTSFSSHFSTFYSPRYLTTTNVYDIHDALLGIPYEHIIILANTDEYGGGGIYNLYTLTTSRHPNFKPVVVHEFGHSFGGLGDEYFYEGDVISDVYPIDVEPWEPNITTMVDFNSKWADMLEEGTPVPTPVSEKEKYPVGAFEGGGYATYGIFRPADECRMRNNTYPTFCPVCRRSLDRLIRFYVE